MKAGFSLQHKPSLSSWCQKNMRAKTWDSGATRQDRKTSTLAQWRSPRCPGQVHGSGQKNTNTTCKWTEVREANACNIWVLTCSNNKREKWLVLYRLLSGGPWPLYVHTPQATSVIAFPSTWTTVTASLASARSFWSPQDTEHWLRSLEFLLKRKSFYFINLMTVSAIQKNSGTLTNTLSYRSIFGAVWLIIKYHKWGTKLPHFSPLNYSLKPWPFTSLLSTLSKYNLALCFKS